MKAYPYKTKTGHCSILEAKDMQDAIDWLGQNGKGTIFCEIEIEPAKMMSMYGPDIDSHVNNFLSLNPIVQT